MRSESWRQGDRACLLEVLGRWERQGKIDQLGVTPIHNAQIKMRRNLANLIADPLRYDRRFGVIQHNTFFPVEPTVRLVHLGNNGLNAEGGDFIAEIPALGVEDLALPGEEFQEARCDLRKAVSRSQ